MYKLRKYDYLDQLRGIAIIGVLFTHLHYLDLSFWTSSFLDNISWIWWMWVPLFFILSAYTLSLSYNSRRYKESHPLQNFYIRRFFRIYPLFLFLTIFVFFLLSYVTIHYVIDFSFDTHWYNLVVHISFLFWVIPKYIGSMYMGEWSLFNELVFYILFPLFFILWDSKKKYVLFITIIIAFIVSYGTNIFTQIYGLYDVYGTPVTHLYSFLLGVLLFKIRDTYVDTDTLKNLRYLNIALFFILGILYFMYGYLYVYPFFIWNLALFMYLFIKGQFFFRWEILWRFLKFTGIISYSLYLINYWFYILAWFFFNNFLVRYIDDNIIFEFTYFIFIVWVLFLISFLSYKYIEQPGILLWKKVITKTSQ